MTKSTAVHGNAILPVPNFPGAGARINYAPSGATVHAVSPVLPFPDGMVGTFICPIPNPVNAPITASGIRIDASRNDANVRDVKLYSGDTLVSTTDVPVNSNITFPLVLKDAAVGNDDEGWCLVVTVEFLNKASSITVYSLAVEFP